MRERSAALLAAALRYGALGWPVVALHHPDDAGRCSCRRPDCAHSGKHPRFHRDDLPHGLHSASTDPARIQRWWVRWPQANVGIVTGACSGLLVVDLDAGARPDDLPTTRLVRTGQGLHIYLAHPGFPVRNAVRLLPGLDVRGDDGMVVAPPSRHASGITYVWASVGPILPAPTWLSAALQRPPPRAIRERPVTPRPAAAPRSARAEQRIGPAYAQATFAAVAAELRAAVVGTRNTRLNYAAFRLGQIQAAGLLTAPGYAAQLAASAQALGLPAHEVARTLASGLRAGWARSHYCSITPRA